MNILFFNFYLPLLIFVKYKFYFYIKKKHMI